MYKNIPYRDFTRVRMYDASFITLSDLLVLSDYVLVCIHRYIDIYLCTAEYLSHNIARQFKILIINI